MRKLFWIGLLMYVFGVAGLMTGCSSAPAVRRPIYRETQFNSRLEYLRFCMHYHMMTDRCE